MIFFFWVLMSVQLLSQQEKCTQLSDVLVTSRSSLKNYQEYNKTKTDGQNYQPQRDLVLPALVSTLYVCECVSMFKSFSGPVVLFLSPQKSYLQPSPTFKLFLLSSSFPHGTPGLVPLCGYLELAYFSLKICFLLFIYFLNHCYLSLCVYIIYIYIFVHMCMCMYTSLSAHKMKCANVFCNEM